MTSNERADFRFSICPYREIIGCNNFMCLDCPDEEQTYQRFLFSQKLKLYHYEKNLIFSQNSSPCPF